MLAREKILKIFLCKGFKKLANYPLLEIAYRCSIHKSCGTKNLQQRCFLTKSNIFYFRVVFIIITVYTNVVIKIYIFIWDIICVLIETHVIEKHNRKHRRLCSRRLSTDTKDGVIKLISSFYLNGNCQ